MTRRERHKGKTKSLTQNMAQKYLSAGLQVPDHWKRGQWIFINKRTNEQINHFKWLVLIWQYSPSQHSQVNFSCDWLYSLFYTSLFNLVKCTLPVRFLILTYFQIKLRGYWILRILTTQIILVCGLCVSLETMKRKKPERKMKGLMGIRTFALVNTWPVWQIQQAHIPNSYEEV